MLEDVNKSLNWNLELIKVGKNIQNKDDKINYLYVSSSTELQTISTQVKLKFKLKLNSSLWKIIAAIHTCVSPETRHTFVTFGWINSLWTCADFIIWSHLMARSTWMGTFSFWLNFNNFFVVAVLLHHPTVIVVLKL